MQIGIVAKKVGVSVDAIRFYERNALLPRPTRTQGGFRQYGERDIETLAFIRRVQGLGFKLSEVRGLLSLRGSRMQPCAPVQRRLQAKLIDVRQKLENLHKLERELRLALRSCDNELRKRDGHCRSCGTQMLEKAVAVNENRSFVHRRVPVSSRRNEAGARCFGHGRCFGGDS